jgi:ABC-type antimicrobial peptide transport system permease subunit
VGVAYALAGLMPAATGRLGGPGGSGGAFLGYAPPTFSPATIALVIVLSVAIGLVAGLVPAYRAARMSPVSALRYE